MKQLIIYIEIHKNRPLSFENNLLITIKKKHPEQLILDLDNFSSPELFKHTLEACGNTEMILLIINSKETNLPMGQVLNFLNKILRRNNVLIDSYLLGEHSTAEKMLQKTKTLKTLSANDYMM